MQFVVPQFIEVEAKIIGPISARQFIEVVVSLALCFAWYKIFNMYVFIPLIFLTCAFCGIMAFAKVNSQAMHYFVLNLIQTFKRPRLKVWQRTLYQKQELAVQVVKQQIAEKPEITESRLASMSLMVDTGGVYVTDEVRQADAQVSALSTADQAPAPDQDSALQSTNQKKQPEDTSQTINLGK